MYGKLKNISTKLIKKFGLPCEVKLYRGGSYDPETGGMSNSEEVIQSAHCIFDNLAYDFSRNGQISSPMVQQGDVIIYVTAEASPELSAQIIANNETWAVINAQPIKPADIAVIYQCHARRVNNG